MSRLGQKQDTVGSGHGPCDLCRYHSGSDQQLIFGQSLAGYVPMVTGQDELVRRLWFPVEIYVRCGSAVRGIPGAEMH